MRLFIAIRFDDNILNSLTAYQDSLKGLGVTGNYAKRDNLHITMAFIGDYEDPDKVLAAMKHVGFRPIKISLDGTGSFGDLFWVGLSDNYQLAGYVKRLRKELYANEIPFDKKRFSPHITLIRKCSFSGNDETIMPDPPKGNMTATRVSLMRSERGENGMIYTEIGFVGE
ncbi:MAG: RNA 2',3'-cyclic phosphodiesterase [Clostridiales bacterium]|nr:RNA 2',3'-cyclic phosphodiesterase [Clostridiales bacterium]